MIPKQATIEELIVDWAWSGVDFLVHLGFEIVGTQQASGRESLRIVSRIRSSTRDEESRKKKATAKKRNTALGNILNVNNLRDEK